jgi:hypothetical protein
MLELKITDSMYRLAWARSRDAQKMKKNDKGIVEYLGQIVANEFIKGSIPSQGDKIVAPNSSLIEVKTKICTSEPLPHNECSIEAANIGQNCDYYTFVRVEYLNNVYVRGWYLGHMHKDAFYYNARKLLKGQKDGDNWFTIKSDCYNISISSLSLDFGVFNEQ